MNFGGRRNPDGQGFAAFGRVVRGMDVVKAIQASPTGQRGEYGTESLEPPIRILKAYRREGEEGPVNVVNFQSPTSNSQTPRPIGSELLGNWELGVVTCAFFSARLASSRLHVARDEQLRQRAEIAVPNTRGHRRIH